MVESKLLREDMEQLDQIFGNDFTVYETPVPFPMSAINAHCLANDRDENFVFKIDLEKSSLPLHLIPDYLAHMKVQFILPEENLGLTTDLMSRDLWFKKNNVTFEYLRNVSEDLGAFLLNLPDHTLAQCSALEFENTVVDKAKWDFEKKEMSWSQFKKKEIESNIGKNLSFLLKGFGIL